MSDIEDQVRRYAAELARNSRPVELPEVTAGRRHRSRAPLLTGIAATMCAVVVAGIVIVGSADHGRSPTPTTRTLTTSTSVAPACAAAGLDVTSTTGERLHPDWLPAGFVRTEGHENDLGPRGQLTYTVPGGGDQPRAELLRYHTAEALERLAGDGSHHPTTVQGHPAVYNDGAPNPAFTSVAWTFAAGTALVVSGYQLSEAQLLQIADHVAYEPGTSFTYPAHPHVSISRDEALAQASGPARDRLAVLSSLGEVDAVMQPTGPINHVPSIGDGRPVTAPVWVVWNTVGSLSVAVIDAETGARITTSTGFTPGGLSSLTDRSDSGTCAPPFGVVTRSEMQSLRPEKEEGVTQTTKLTTLGDLFTTRVGGGVIGQCALATCDPSTPVWVVIDAAPDSRFSDRERGLAPRPTGTDVPVGSWQAIAYDARTGPQDSEISAGGVSIGSGPPPADLTALPDLN